MENNILLSKVVANPTDTTWSQAYSTLNLYIVLSIKAKEGEEDIVAKGKELFEKIQREYFSLDDKSLKNIKTSVGAAVGEFQEDNEISVALATITDNILYIVTAGKSSVVIKREGKIGKIAAGELNKVIAFSGELKGDDVIIIETQDFAEKISIQKLTETLDNLEVSEISESLAPVLHEGALGTEAAIILQYKTSEDASSTTGAVPIPEEEREAEGEAEKNISEEDARENDELEDIEVPTKRKFSLPSFTLAFPSFKSMGKKKVIIIAIIVLAILLVTSIFFEGRRQEAAKRDAALTKILEPAQTQYDEALSLINLNEGLALEELEKIKKELESQRSNFPEGSSQLKKLDEFIGMIETKIGELTEGVTLTGQKIIFDDSDFSIFRDGNLIAVTQSGIVNILNSTGNLEEEFDSENENVAAITADETYVYILGDSGITRTDISDGDTEEVVASPGETVAIDLFGSNVYGLNVDTDSIDRYSGSSFSRGDYLNEGVKLVSPASMSIDASIWVTDDGKIRKFTRGAEDSFSVSGLSNFSDKTVIFTSIDYDNLYVLDIDARKIYIISKSGTIENQFSWGEIASATSISADEENSVIYISTDGKLYSFEF